MGIRKRKVDDVSGPAQTPAGTAATMAPDGDSFADAFVLCGAPEIHTVRSQPTRERGRPLSQTASAAASSETTSVTNPGTGTAATVTMVAQWQPSRWPGDQQAAHHYQHQDSFAGYGSHQQEFLAQQPLQPGLPAAFVGAPWYAPQHSLPKQSTGHHMAAPPEPPYTGISAQPQKYASSSPFAGFAPAPVVPDLPADPGQMEQQLGYAKKFIILLRGVSNKGVGVIQRLIQEQGQLIREKAVLAEQLDWEKAAREEGLKAEETRFRHELIREKEHLACELRAENARLSDEVESERRKAETERRNVSALQSKLRLVRRAQARALGQPPGGESAAAPIDLGSPGTTQPDADCCWACRAAPAAVKLSPCGHCCLCGSCFDGAFMFLVMDDDDLWCPICDVPAVGEWKGVGFSFWRRYLSGLDRLFHLGGMEF